MRHRPWIAALLLPLALAPVAHAGVSSPESTLDGLRSEKGDRAITFVGAEVDVTDLAATGFGAAGFWLPHIDAASGVIGRPTGEHALDTLPEWVGAFNHTTSPVDPGCTEPGALERGCLPTYAFRTFSQDGPARSAGGFADWSMLRLPSGECRRSGAIVDPQTFLDGPNNNNTVNRIQLQDGTPPSFHVGVLTDNTAGEHDANRLEIRGNVGLLDVPPEVADSQIEPSFAEPPELAFNGVPDLYVFRVDGFVSGDYLKLRLRGASSPAAFGGLLFDLTIPANTAPGGEPCAP